MFGKELCEGGSRLLRVVREPRSWRSFPGARVGLIIRHVGNVPTFMAGGLHNLSAFESAPRHELRLRETLAVGPHWPLVGQRQHRVWSVAAFVNDAAVRLNSGHVSTRFCGSLLATVLRAAATICAATAIRPGVALWHGAHLAAAQPIWSLCSLRFPVEWICPLHWRSIRSRVSDRPLPVRTDASESTVLSNVWPRSAARRD